MDLRRRRKQLANSCSRSMPGPVQYYNNTEIHNKPKSIFMEYLNNGSYWSQSGKCRKKREHQPVYFISNNNNNKSNKGIGFESGSGSRSGQVITKLSNGHCLQWWSTYFTVLFYLGFMPARIKLDPNTGHFVLHTHRVSKTLSMFSTALSFFASIGYLRSLGNVKSEDDCQTFLNVAHLCCSFTSSMTMLHLFSTGFPTFLRVFNLIGPKKRGQYQERLDLESSTTSCLKCKSDSEFSLKMDFFTPSSQCFQNENDEEVSDRNFKEKKSPGRFRKIRKILRMFVKTRFRSAYFLVAVACAIGSSFELGIPGPWNAGRMGVVEDNRGFVNGLVHPWRPLSEKLRADENGEFYPTPVDYTISVLLQIDYAFISIGDSFVFFTVFFYGQMVSEFCHRTKEQPHRFLRDLEKLQSVIREMNSVMRRYLLTSMFANIPYFVWRIPPIMLVNPFTLEQARHLFIFSYYLVCITYGAVKHKQLEDWANEWLCKRENSSKLSPDRLSTLIRELSSFRDMELKVGIFSLNPSLWATVISSIVIFALITVT